MADTARAASPTPPASVGRFGAGLTEIEISRFQTILRKECNREVGLPETWSRAIELLSLAEMLLEPRETPAPTTRHPQGSRSLALDRFAGVRDR